MKQFDLAIVIGRFQPFHRGHRSLVLEAKKLSDEVLLVLGSHEAAPSLNNPLNAEQRLECIKRSLDFEVSFLFMHDSYYDPASWYQTLETKISETHPQAKRIALVGHTRDSSSYYLKDLDKFTYFEVPSQSDDVSGAKIRQAFFAGELAPLKQYLSNAAFDCLEAFGSNPVYQKLKAEFDYCEAYKKSWKVAPYPVNFVTCDVLLVHKKKVLLIERKNHPGQGLLALPGGFLEQDETIVEGALRELHEETGLSIEGRKPALSHVFGDPGRDPRGRIITHVFAFEALENDHFEVKASDDAQDHLWLAIGELGSHRSRFFSDHGRIIGFMLQKLGYEL